MKIKYTLFCFILITFPFFHINSKKCKGCKDCKNMNNDYNIYGNSLDNINKGFIANKKYFYLDNKNINITKDKLHLTMDFIGIKPSSSNISDFSVNYTVNFFDQEKVGIDEIQAELTGINPLYSSYMIKQNPESNLTWKLNIKENDEKEQIAQIIATAQYNDITETFAYNSFRFTYSKNNKQIEDRTFEFWLIFCSFLGIIVITFIGMYVYIYSTLEIGRNTLVLNNISTANFDKSDAEPEGEGSSRTTA